MGRTQVHLQVLVLLLPADRLARTPRAPLRVAVQPLATRNMKSCNHGTINLKLRVESFNYDERCVFGFKIPEILGMALRC
jgi:hypothetical protein